MVTDPIAPADGSESRAPERGEPRPREQDRVPPLAARLLAAGALVVLAATLVLIGVSTARHPGYLVATLVAVSLGVSAVWIVFTNRRWRWLALVAGVVLVAGAVAAERAAGAGVLVVAILLGGIALASTLGSLALRDEVAVAVAPRWRPVPAADHPVLLMNPKSGGGKVERYRLADQCATRGIEAVVLGPGDDLRALAESAVARGADVIGMAGGDGSQAIVASVAASHEVAFVCVPAGTRNHLALDLGVERDDVVGALDAFGPARECAVDLGEVNDRVFVNNVSLGLYATMVSSQAYRDEKLKTAAQKIEQNLGPDAPPYDLHLDGPAGPVDGAQILEISNNPYALTSLTELGTRFRLDTGTLGIVSVQVPGRSGLRSLLRLETAGQPARFPGLRTWTAPAVEVRSASTVAAGVDGEACELEPPLRFRSRPAALRVRVAGGHPGASAAIRRVPLASSTVTGLWRLVRGRPSGLVA